MDGNDYIDIIKAYKKENKTDKAIYGGQAHAAAPYTEPGEPGYPPGKTRTLTLGSRTLTLHTSPPTPYSPPSYYPQAPQPSQTPQGAVPISIGVSPPSPYSPVLPPGLVNRVSRANLVSQVKLQLVFRHHQNNQL
jgi:hypothetical protein